MKFLFYNIISPKELFLPRQKCLKNKIIHLALLVLYFWFFGLTEILQNHCMELYANGFFVCFLHGHGLTERDDMHLHNKSYCMELKSLENETETNTTHTKNTNMICLPSCPHLALWSKNIFTLL